MLGVLSAPAWCLERSILACVTTLVKQSCGIERHRVKSCDYSRERNDVKGKWWFPAGNLALVCRQQLGCPTHAKSSCIAEMVLYIDGMRSHTGEAYHHS